MGSVTFGFQLINLRLLMIPDEENIYMSFKDWPNLSVLRFLL